MDDSADDDQTRVASEDAEGRDSGIVEVERKASAVTGGVTSAAVSLPTSTNEITGTRESVPKSLTRDSEIEIDTDLAEASAPRAQMITQTNEKTLEAASAGDASASAEDDAIASAEDDAIPVSDDEIESAEPARPTLTSGLPAFTRSRPPARPSLRPRASGTSLPPPRSLLGSSLPPPSFPSQFPSERLRPSERDPWILANKTLELSRANARITALEDQIAFRDARIQTLEERLESAQQRIAELEAKLELAPSVARPGSKPSRALTPSGTLAAAPGVARASSPAKPASPSKQVSIPKPADMSKPPSSRQPSSVASVSPAAVLATGPVPVANGRAEATPAAPRVAAASSGAASAVPVEGATKAEPAAQTPEPPEASESVPPPALVAELTASRAPNGPEDLQRIAGIGPRFEAALRKQGITRVSQVASWSEADIRQVAKALKIPKSRIIKGRWVETARELSK